MLDCFLGCLNQAWWYEIDIVVDGKIRGLRFFGLLEDISNLFLKGVDLIRLSQIQQDSDTYNKVMEGIVLYER